jgi:hypothetical protein
MDKEFDLLVSWCGLSLEERLLVSFDEVWRAWEKAKIIGDIPEIKLLQEELMCKADCFSQYKKIFFEKGFFDGAKEREDVFWKMLVDSMLDFDEAFNVYKKVFSEKRNGLEFKIIELIKKPAQMVELVHYFKFFYSRWNEVIGNLLPNCSLQDLADYIKSSRTYLDSDVFLEEAKDLSVKKASKFDEYLLLLNLFNGYSSKHYNLVFPDALQAAENNFKQLLNLCFLAKNDLAAFSNVFFSLINASSDFSDFIEIWSSLKDNNEAKKYLISKFPEIAVSFEDYLWIWKNIPENREKIWPKIFFLADSFEKVKIFLESSRELEYKLIIWDSLKKIAKKEMKEEKCIE